MSSSNILKIKKEQHILCRYFYYITGCSMGNGAVTGAGSATSGDTISRSARERIIQSVGRTCCDWRAALASGGVGGSSGGVSSGSSNRGLRNLGTELASGVRKLMRGHENNVRSLFAGREEAAMRQTEGLRVHVESTIAYKKVNK